jgi:catechol 2,3-dioxygenase-like lactoylglutathione lyase family enzyme
MQESVTFYTKVLDFELIGRWPDLGDPALSLLVREGSELHLSSHRGDGAPGQAIIVLTTDIDALFMKFRVRGLVPVSDSPAYLGPTDQTSGTREFHVDDPTGNTLRFVQRPS